MVPTQNSIMHQTSQCLHPASMTIQKRLVVECERRPFTVLGIRRYSWVFRTIPCHSFRCTASDADFLTIPSHLFVRANATLHITPFRHNQKPLSMQNDVTTLELRFIFKISGYSQADFARYIDRSPAFVNGLCSCYHSPVPFRWVEQARKMIGDETFDEALVRARIKIQYQTGRKYV